MTNDHFADLTSEQVEAVLAGPRTPVILLPVGAVEAHGPHGPLATDTIIAATHCERTAAALAADDDPRALILPPLPFGVTRYAGDFPGTIGVAEETLRGLLLDLGHSLADSGFGHLVVVNHHFEPAHVKVLRDAVASLAADGMSAALLDLTRRRNAERLTEEFRRGSCHAGRYETSLILAERPDLVATDRARTLPELPVDMPGAMAAGRTDFKAMGMDRAYCGAPAEATAAEGEATYAVLVEMLAELVRGMVRGEP
ncbi:MAG: creatininase family protein [Actinobacteria bacterium]|nr:creatininase family protein [Actinomycetota bacterium]